MPGGVGVGCVSWDNRDGWLCCGAGNGLIKIIKLDGDSSGQAKVTTFTLTGHTESNSKVTACCWNEAHRKLTTTDETGHIVVWAKHESQWHEEMINNRNKSVVTDMRWSPDGTRICIAYRDGAVIVGNVDGARMWGKELQMALDKLTWSPNGQNIVFSTMQGEVYVYDADGNQISQLKTDCPSSGRLSRLAGLEWYNYDLLL